jgi:hypothetical protein
MDDALSGLEVHIDFGTVAGSFVRVEVRAESWDAAGTFSGWVSLARDEARRVAQRLVNAADEVERLRGG